MDRDNTKGGLTGGPETITVKEHNGKYLVYVHQYTSGPAQDMCSARPKITIYPGKEKNLLYYFRISLTLTYSYHVHRKQFSSTDL